MPINSITTQPGTNSLSAAYRPVAFKVNAGGLPPVVYCDIYFNSIFYKTLSKTLDTFHDPVNSDWDFDIQDAAQEYLGKFLGGNGGTALLDAAPVMVQAFCKFRSSQFDANGFILPDGTAPIQGTSGTPPVPGTGTTSHIFYIVNATLQHEDNQSLAAHLAAFRTGTWLSTCYPLTHRPKVYHMARNDSDYFPAIMDDSICIVLYRLKYKPKGGVLIHSATSGIAYACNGVITSLTVVQTGGTADAVVSWTATGNITGYLYSLDGGPLIATTNTSVTLTGLSVAGHSIDVVPLCMCANGPIRTQAFTILNPVTFVCTGTVTDVVVAQTGIDTVLVSFALDIGSNWYYSLDGGAELPIPTNPFSISGLTIADHTVKVQVYCSNGVAGGNSTASFTVTGAPSITKVAESTTGGIRTQVFEIGPNVSDGNVFTLGIYFHNIVITALANSPDDIANALKDAINATSTTDWDSAGAAPPMLTPGFPPAATSSGHQVTVTMDISNSFAYFASFS